MIEFISLFVGLFHGVQPVEMKVTGPVVVVEVLLDGETVVQLSKPPWRVDVDLGAALEPHELVAVALDGEGRELDRVRQLINRSAPVRGSPGAEVLVVRDPWVQPHLDLIAKARFRREIEMRPELEKLLRTTERRGLEGPHRRATAVVEEAARFSLGLGDDTRLRFLSPIAAPVSHVDVAKSIFATVSYPTSDLGLLWLLEEGRQITFPPRFADAVALAGMELSAGGDRRAVVLLLASDSRDASLYTPAQVRAYLTRLEVPLFVWKFGEELSAEWPESVLISGSQVDRLAALEDAVEQLREVLAERKSAEEGLSRSRY